MRTAILATLSITTLACPAQVLTPEDSLLAGIGRRDASTVISGYGEVKASRHEQSGTAKANLTRAVLFVGHRFNHRISFLSELEVEDAMVSADGEGGEVAFEQLVLKLDVNRDLYVLAGLYTPRLGIINENHLPTTFNGNDRPLLETVLIPATWREIGACLYGTAHALGGFNWTFGVMNGLNAAGFEQGKFIRGGRGEGSDAGANTIGLTGSLLKYAGRWRAQVSAWYGGSGGERNARTDSLGVERGLFAWPVSLLEADARYRDERFSLTALACMGAVPDARAINDLYASNTPRAALGGYVEGAVDLLELVHAGSTAELNAFVRFEHVDLRADLPDNAALSVGPIEQWCAGFTWQPAAGVSLKADVLLRSTATAADADRTTGAGLGSDDSWINLGFGYSF